jgi:hypothetical protein
VQKYFGSAIVSAIFLVLVSLPASAGSVNTFSNVTLQGVSNTTVGGSFSFDTKTDQFSNISIAFSGNSIFAGIKATDSNSIQGFYIPGKGWLMSWVTTVKGDLVWYSVLYNPATGQFTASGGISNWQNQGNFNYLSVPEGGAMLGYLLLSGMAVFAGILMSDKKRRLMRVTQSS